MTGQKYSKLETSDLKQVHDFVNINAEKLETAELTVKRSAGVYVVEIRPTDEPI